MKSSPRRGAFRVSVSFVVNLVKAFRVRGSLAPKPSGGRRHAKLEPHRAFLLEKVAEKADITMPELAAELAAALREGRSRRFRVGSSHRLSLKKTLRAGEHDRPDIKQAREEWTLTRQPIMRLEPHRLVFLDESGTTTKMARLRGRSLRGQRLLSKVQFGHWKTQTFIDGLRCDARPPP